MIDPVVRFTEKVRYYQPYRWNYSPSAVNMAFEIAQLSSNSCVADIGSGTGMLAQHFLHRVDTVYAVEPNAEMRQVGEDLLGKYPSFKSVSGCAEATTLPDNCVDLINVGRAIHWFLPEAARDEFIRILKPGGWLAIFQVPCLDQGLLDAIKSIQKEDNGWRVREDKSSLFKVPFSFFFEGEIITQQFPYNVRETLDQFTGRLLSISSSPDKSDENFEKFLHEAERVFNHFSQDRCLTIPVATEVHLGRIKMGRDKGR